MTTPKWQGSDRALGPYRFRVLWFRVLAASAVSFGLGVFYAMQTAETKAESAPRARARHAKKTPLIAPKPLPKLEQHLDPLNQATRARLEAQRIDLNFDQTPFNDTIAFLRDITNLNFVITNQARDIIENESLEVSLKLKSISLKNALALCLAASADLRYEIREGIILITSNDETTPQLFLEYYDLRDLLDGRLLGKGGAHIGAEKMVELIEQLLGDNFDEGRIEYNEPILIARTDLRGHQAIARLIRHLREGPDRIRPEAAWITAFKKELERRIDFNGKDTPFVDVVAFLQDLTGLNIAVSREIDTEEIRVDLQLKNTPVRTVLDLLLESLHLSYSFDNEALIIHPRESGYGRYDLRVLDIRDLIPENYDEDDCGCIVVIPSQTNAQGGQVLDFDCEEEEEYCGLDPEQICELIRSETGEGSWEDPASIEYHRGQLLIVQTPSVQRRIDAVLAKMRTVNWRD